MASNSVWFHLVDGEGKAYTSASKVRIPSDGDVDEFRDAVKAKYADSHLKGIAPSDLLVYANKAAFDVNTVNAPTNLQPEDKIGDYGAMHAKMYVVGPRAVQEEEETKPVTLKQLRQYDEEKEAKKRKCVAISNISTSNVNCLIDGLSMAVIVGHEKKITKNGIPAFQWDANHIENEQIAAYSKYLHGHIDGYLSENALCLMDVTPHRHLLDVRDKRCRYDLSGTADMMVLQDLGEYTAENLQYLCGLRLVLELKKDPNAMKDAQAIAELIAANLKRPETSPVALMTDLQQKWCFMWLSANRKIQKLILKHPTNAFIFIGKILLSKDEDMSMCNPFEDSSLLPKKLPMRGSIDKLFPPDSGNIGEMIERYRSLEGGSWLDWSMEREIGWKVVEQMPEYRNMYS